ncbi:MAG: 50S ribosomal protein L25 [Planctomycetota bacterium]
MSETLNVQKREQTGSLRMKRLRQTGMIPAVLYGHGQETLMLTVPAKEMNKAINLGSYVVELKGACNENALIKEVQWDAFGIDVLHVDLTRVSEKEAIEITLPLELKGDAPGANRGGEVKFLQNELKIMCPADRLPEKIEVNISELDVDQTISASDIVLPQGVELGEDGTTPIVICTPKASDEPEDADGEPTPAAEN